MMSVYQICLIQFVIGQMLKKPAYIKMFTRKQIIEMRKRTTGLIKEKGSIGNDYFFLVLSKNQWWGPHEMWPVLLACSRRRNSFGDTGTLYRKNGLWEDSWKMRTILICTHEVRHSWGNSRTNKTQHAWKLLDVVRGKRLRKGETGELGGKKKTGLDQTAEE